MILKNYAYLSQQKLEPIVGGSFKRSHFYELLAASFGFKSYAALSSDCVFTQQEDGNTSQPPDQAMIHQRFGELGYDPAILELAVSTFQSCVSENNIDVVDVAELVGKLREDPFYGEQFSNSPFSREYQPLFLESLESKASAGDHLAHYALALLYSPNEQNSGGQDGEYWYRLERNGRELTGFEKDFAEEYARQLWESEKHAFHLRAAGKLGNSSALLDLAELFQDPSYLDALKKRGISDDPMRASSLAEALGRKEDVEYWLIEAAKNGEVDAMRYLISDFCNEDIQSSWMWFYLAEKLGTDLTKSDMHAYHEGGPNADQRYDDDVGGSLYADGHEGLVLEPLDEDGKREAKDLATRMFLEIQQPI